MGFLMKNSLYGFYLFPKLQSQTGGAQAIVLKEMLQFLKTQHKGRNTAFTFVESETSLIPHLTLWENLHVVSGTNSWKEFSAQLEVDWLPLVNLIHEPNCKASDASAWERLTISLLKAAWTQTPHILVDMNEDLHSPFNLMIFKKMLLNLAQQKNVYIATTNTSLWLDSIHSLVTRDGYEFKILELDHSLIKRHRVA
jgi:ABC-type lipoprotein export system ATPase subunit